MTVTNASDAEHRYSTDALVDLARSHGERASARLILDWVSAGLLDRPERRGLGRGKGSVATWPIVQAEIFLALLRQRHEVKQIAALCKLPVWCWLYYGDCTVPLRQVQRAILTWGGMAKTGSLDSA